MGNEKNPQEWGWKKSRFGLVFVTTLDAPAPESLLKSIACKCKTGCRGSACGCRKTGLHCSIMCTHCNGSCDNAPDEDLSESMVDEPRGDGLHFDAEADFSDEEISDQIAGEFLSYLFFSNFSAREGPQTASRCCF